MDNQPTPPLQPALQPEPIQAPQATAQPVSPVQQTPPPTTALPQPASPDPAPQTPPAELPPLRYSELSPHYWIIEAITPELLMDIVNAKQFTDPDGQVHYIDFYDEHPEGEVDPPYNYAIAAAAVEMPLGPNATPAPPVDNQP